MQIVCERDGCSTVLRRTPGRHHPDEPELGWDEDGPYIECPRCGVRHRELAVPVPARARDGDDGAAA